MTSTSDRTAALPGRPPVVVLGAWQVARDELLGREEAHTRAGDALAARPARAPPLTRAAAPPRVTGRGRDRGVA